jgi:hypothetical protein
MGESYRVVRIVAEKPSFLRKYRRWFEFSSVAIVFGTFFVNQVLRDQSKDLADSLQSARLQFRQRQELHALANDLYGIQKQAEYIEDTILSSKQHRTTEQQKDEDQRVLIQRWKAGEIDISAEFDNIVELFLELPYDLSLDEKRWALSDSVTHRQALSEHSELLQSARDANDKNAEDYEEKKYDDCVRQWKSDDEKLKTLFGEEAISSERGTALGASLDMFRADLEQRVSRLHDVAKNRYELWKRLSLFLYPVGVVVGLMAKTSGEDSEPPE